MGNTLAVVTNRQQIHLENLRDPQHAPKRSWWPLNANLSAQEILFRAEGVPPSPKHTIGDHKNGDTLDNRRRNLRWATPVMNARNQFGSYALQHHLAL